MRPGPILILGIESSCDDTAGAVLLDGEVRSNVVAGQQVHAQWGGVVPELASRAHQENMVPVVDRALREAGVAREQLTAIAFTQGPGLIGALLVGCGFAKSMAQALGIPMIGVDHLHAHAFAHFIRDDQARLAPTFPFLNLTVSGGHTLLVSVRSPVDLDVLGTTLDDAAGEAFDKGAKIIGLPYPGGPLVDQLAEGGDPLKFELPVPAVPGLDMSFSGIKTAFLNIVRKGVAVDPAFIENERAHLCASLRHAIVSILLGKLRKAARAHGFTQVAISGGVSANALLRRRLVEVAAKEGWQAHVPPLAYCTDNAAMIAMAGHFLLERGAVASLGSTPFARSSHR